MDYIFELMQKIPQFEDLLYNLEDMNFQKMEKVNSLINILIETKIVLRHIIHLAQNNSNFANKIRAKHLGIIYYKNIILSTDEVAHTLLQMIIYYITIQNIKKIETSIIEDDTKINNFNPNNLNDFDFNNLTKDKYYKINEKIQTVMSDPN